MNYMGQSKRDYMELLQQYQAEDLESFVYKTLCDTRPYIEE